MRCLGKYENEEYRRIGCARHFGDRDCVMVRCDACDAVLLAGVRDRLRV